MLSKVLSGRDRERAVPLAFHPVSVRHSDPALQKDQADNAGAESETRALRDRILRFEAELTAAKRDSFEAGRCQGEQQARAETAPILDRLNASLSQLAEMRQEIRKKAEKDMVQFALLIAKRILHRELSTDAGALSALARVVFERMVRGESLRVTVHPRFAAGIASALSHNQSARVHIEPDPQCAPGTLIVRSEEGVLDASVDAQLEEISRGLADRLSGGRN
jgi:flagellar biosynthesis/type III secretory pathway protein FliH